MVLGLPAGGATRTLHLRGSTDGATFTTLAAAAGRTFDPATGNTLTVALPTATARHVRVTFTTNRAWPAGQVSGPEIHAS